MNLSIMINCYDHSFLNVKFILKQSNVSITITSTVRLGKGWMLHWLCCGIIICPVHSVLKIWDMQAHDCYVGIETETSMHIYISLSLISQWFHLLFLGNAQQVQFLGLLVFAAAREDAQQFIKNTFPGLLNRKAGLWCLQGQSTIAWSEVLILVFNDFISVGEANKHNFLTGIRF